MKRTTQAIIVGGGLAGLIAALRLARAGRRVSLFEARGELGGRARTLRTEGLDFNLGPHALYRAGAAHRILADLGIVPDGTPAPLAGAIGWRSGRAHALPVGPVSLLWTGLLSLRDKLDVAGWLGRLDQMQSGALTGRSVASWLDELALGRGGRALIEAFVRLATYADAPSELDAGQVVLQLQRSTKGVLYLHGGWGRMIEALRAAAVAAGVQVHTGVKVTGVLGGGRFAGVRLADGGRVEAPIGLLAIPPTPAVELLGDRSAPLAAACAPSVVAQMACLNLGLSGLPRPRRVFGLAIDTPDYASVHSSVARLGEGQVAHVARLTAPGAEPASREVLESVFERLQPGFRDRLLHAGYLPKMTASHGLPAACAEGRRPQPRRPELPGLFVAGDWVGDEGMLADAAVASADRAAALMARSSTEAAAA